METRDAQGSQGAAFYQYEIENKMQTRDDQDSKVSRFIKIGIRVRCFNNGPAGYQCMHYGEEFGINDRTWYEALKDENEEDINPVKIAEIAHGIFS